MLLLFRLSKYFILGIILKCNNIPIGYFSQNIVSKMSTKTITKIKNIYKIPNKYLNIFSKHINKNKFILTQNKNKNK